MISSEKPRFGFMYIFITRRNLQDTTQEKYENSYVTTAERFVTLKSEPNCDFRRVILFEVKDDSFSYVNKNLTNKICFRLKEI